MDNEKQRYRELGDFLKSRRAKILPSQVGLPEGIRRRTPGLRREEVALLSGIGLTWYTWIEQGRPIQISSQILESLARTLMLDKHETKHLYTLAQQTPPVGFPICNDTVNPMLQHVLDNLEFSPATILDARFNVISWNKAAAKILFDYGKINASKRNLLRIMFTNEEYKKTIADWEFTAQEMIACFRTIYANFVGNPWIEDFINELRSESKEFDSWWSMHDVKKDEGVLKTINHPVLGQLKFEFTSYVVISDSNLKLSVLTAIPGSDTEEKIKQFLLS
jgi:hypothetical protein